MPDTLEAPDDLEQIDDAEPAERLGVIYLPKSGTGVGVFQFLVDPAAKHVEIDTPVTAVTEEGNIVGVVTDMSTVGSMADPVAADWARQDDSPGALASPDGAVRVATAQVFYSAALRPVSAGYVRSSTPPEIEQATGSDRIAVPIPAGVVTLAGGEFARVNLDGHTLLGPESAHLVIGGLSGQASKTSFAGVLLRSAMHSTRQAGESMSAIVFNVKGEDLVNLDQPPTAGYELTEDDSRIYDALGVPATPFEDVVVYAPALPGGNGTRSSCEDALPLQWDLPTIWPYLKFFSPGLYANDNMAAFLGDFETLLRNPDPQLRVSTFAGFDRWTDSQLQQAADMSEGGGGGGIPFRGHHPATVRRAKKLIMSLPNRCGGLLTRGESKPDQDVPIDHLVDGQVIVVDIAGLEPLVQSAVIARTCERLVRIAEREGINVDHLVLFADELNVFAPATGGEMESVRKILTKISATGRYAGISLWGAAQFPSQVSPQVLGNAATKATGILADSEIDSGVFGRMPAGQRERIATLPKGTMSIKAYNLRGMLTIRFPRPAWATGRPKGQPRTKRATATDVLQMSQKSLSNLTHGVDPEKVEEVIAATDGDVAAAVAALEKINDPDMRAMSVEHTSTFEPDDIWKLD